VRGAWPNKKGFKILKHFLYGCYVQFTAVLWIWIWINIGNADPDPGARNFTKFTNKSEFRPFKEAFYLRIVGTVNLQLYYLKKIYFLCKNSASGDGKV
jgi:hypothetical protein